MSNFFQHEQPQTSIICNQWTRPKKGFLKINVDVVLTQKMQVLLPLELDVVMSGGLTSGHLWIKLNLFLLS